MNRNFLQAASIVLIVLALVGPEVQGQKLPNAQSPTGREANEIQWEESPRVESREVTIDFTQKQQFALTPGVAFGKKGVEPLASQKTTTLIAKGIIVPLHSADPFLAISSVWIGEAVDNENVALSLRGSPDDKTWGEWFDINADDHGAPNGGEHFGRLLYFDKATKHIQYRLTFKKTEQNIVPTLTSLRLIFISPGATPQKVLDKIQLQHEPEAGLQLQSQTQYPKPTVTSRTAWGCTDGQASPLWSPQYTTVTHLIVHHTDNSNSSSDWPAVIRTIWKDHTVTRKWGDIGYNYLIDPNGVVYEGRAGGDNVIGAHFSCVNSNTMGVAALGNFTSVSPTSNALTKVKSLLAWKCDQRGIDPLGATYHNSSQLNLQNISGHQDVNPTTAPSACPTSTVCPGNNLYAQLPSIRTDVKNLLNPTVKITFTTVPAGLQVIVDGILHTTPKFFEWPEKSVHIVTAISPQDGPAGTRYIFSSWNDGSTQNPRTITIPSSNTTYTANFTTQYQLTVNASPSAGGTITPSGTSWRTSGENVPISATSNPGYKFIGWSGNAAGTDNPLTILMDAPKTVTANFTKITPSITITTNPGGRQIIVDGVTYTAPKEFLWEPNSPHTIEASSPQAGATGTRYLFTNWSDGGAQKHTITAPATPTTYTANFGTQYLLTAIIQTDPFGPIGGSVSFIPLGALGDCSGIPERPVSCFWYNSGQSVQLTATKNNGYTFSGWTGSGTASYTGPNNPASVMMNGPITETASFSSPTPNNTFTDISASLTGLSSSSIACGDYDNDGDMDILSTGYDNSGTQTSQLYRNDGGSFKINTSASLVGVGNSSVAWGDYDNDGDIDILLTGSSSSGFITKIYQNDSGNFIEKSMSLSGAGHGSSAWGDYDNDGDLDILLTGTPDGSNAISKIYRNDGNKFVDIGASLTPVQGSAVAWGDYDNDKDLDFILTGSNVISGYISKIFRNDAGNFVAAASLPGVFTGSTAWGDYDNDGDLDILLTGDRGLDPVSKVYRNDGNNFVDVSAALIGVRNGSAEWGDYDNDGDLDILLTGHTGSSYVSKVYRNDNGAFVDLNAGLIGLWLSSCAWFDYNNDGKLDIVLVGSDGANKVAKIYRNDSGTVNTIPAAPSNLLSHITGGTAMLNWNQATDNQTTQKALTYNLRIGTTPGGMQIMSPMANLSTGYRKVSKLGNTNHRNNWTVKNLPAGKYYWSVQAIDNAFAGSAFAVEKSFTISNPPGRAWTARFNGLSNAGDEANALAFDGDGNVYVAGHSLGASGSRDYLTLKYNNAGARQWSARFNAPANNLDEAKDIAVDISSNVYVTGFSFGANGNLDYFTIKYNSAGVQQWVARYNGPGNSDDKANALAIDGAGNVYVTGHSFGSSTGPDFATIKYNSAGKRQWVARYNAPANKHDEAQKIIVDGAGNIYVTGNSYSADGKQDYFTIKYNSAGVQQWFARYNGPGNSDDIVNTATIDGAGNIYVTGHSAGLATGQDYATVKYNSAGKQQWIARYNSPANSTDEARGIAVDGSGNVYVSGYSLGGNNNHDYFTIKYNNAGVQQWSARYDGSGNGDDIANALAIDGAGNIYVTGHSGTDYVTIKYTGTGVRKWIARYNAPANNFDEARDIAVDAAGNVYVTGYSLAANGKADYITIKYSASSSNASNAEIAETESSIPDEIKAEDHLTRDQNTATPTHFSLSQNYPNPFNPTTTIGFTLPVASKVRVTIYNLNGKLVQKLLEGNWPAGYHEVAFDASDLASGTYLYRLEAGSFTATRIMILAK